MIKQNYRKLTQFHKAPYIPSNHVPNYSNYYENKPYYPKQAYHQRGNQHQYSNVHIPSPSYNYPSMDDSFCNYDYCGQAWKNFEKPNNSKCVKPVYKKNIDPYYAKYAEDMHVRYPYSHYYQEIKFKEEDYNYECNYDYNIGQYYGYNEYYAYDIDPRYEDYDSYHYYHKN